MYLERAVCYYRLDLCPVQAEEFCVRTGVSSFGVVIS